MDLSIIIVSWNVREKLIENLDAVLKSDGRFGYEIFVSDNDSEDGTAETLRRKFPQVKLIENKENLGFAKANNLALKYASGRYVLLLNPDMRVFPDTLDNMISWMDNHREAGAAGCRLINEKGRIIRQVRRLPNVWNQLAIILKLPHIFPSIIHDYLRSDFDYGSEAEVDSLRGSFLMIRSEVIEKIGGLDERFFVWFEDVDYCRRIKEAGWKVMYTPEAECLDHVGQSFGQLKRGKAQKYFQESMLKYFLKWGTKGQYRLLKMAWPLGRFMAIFGSFLGIKNKAKT